MKKLLFDNEYATYSINEAEKTIEEYYKPATKNVTLDVLKNILNTFANFFIIYKPRKMFSDNRDLLFPIVPEFQTWIEQNIARTAVENGLLKVARVVSKDLLVQLSLEQMSEEGILLEKLETKFFDNEQDARKWLSQFDYRNF